MRPPARLQAIADLLTNVLESTHPADKMMQSWGRQNRYAGSKDRRDISNRLFFILRHYGHLTARLGTDDPLLVAMLATHIAEEMPLAAVLALADGSAHAPQPLVAADEKTLTHGATHPPENKAGMLSVPEWLLGDIEASLADDTDGVLAAMCERAPLDVRVNFLKTTRDDALRNLKDEGFEARAHPHVDTALRFDGAPRLIESDAFKQGLIEVQDAGAQSVAAMCAAQPFDTVMDYCSGAGGKALALAAQMENKGRVLTYDAIDGRMKAQASRAKRAGVNIIEPLDAAQLPTFHAACDVVVADVPCSGSGRWRRAPETKWRLTAARLAELHEVQAGILQQAAQLVKPKGRLAYMTCSLLASENSTQIARFLSDNPAFQLAQNGQAQLHPLNADTDGFYCAIMVCEGA